MGHPPPPPVWNDDYYEVQLNPRCLGIVVHEQNCSYGVLLLNANTQIPLVHLQAQENFLMCKFPVSCLPFLSWCSYTNVLMCSLHQPLCWYHLRFSLRPPPPPPPSFNLNEYVGKRVYADISENTRIINAVGEMKSNLCISFTMSLIHLY